ncbi:unnamed protein product [Sphagnum compactum]
MRSSSAADDHESLCIMEALSRSQNSAETRVDGPKLEDFLGGKSLGGQYSDQHDHHHSHHHQQQQQLEGLYYNAAAASFQESQTRINVNLPYTHSSAVHEHQQLQENNLLAQSRSHLHAQNLLQRALDQQQQQSDCNSLQSRPHESSSSSGLKSWLRHQADADSKLAAAAAAAAVGPQASTARHSSGLSAPLVSWQPLSLSMSAGSSHVTDHTTMDHHLVLPGHHHVAAQTSPRAAAPVSEPRKRGTGRMGAAATSAAGGKDGSGPSPRKSIDTFGQRTSVYRGVTRHRWTGRYEAHLWDNSCRKEGQTRKGRQGGYDKEDKAARAYDLAALKYWGPSTTINFPLSTYEAELEVMKNMTRQEYVASLRRKSSGFSRGASAYRGVTRHHQHGRWQARIGRVAGNKDLYLGTYSTQEEAAEAYDMAAIKFRGVNAVTNFDMSRYDPQKIHAAAINGQHGQEISFKCNKLPADQKLLITELSSTPSSDAVIRVQDENHRIVSSSLATGAPGSRLELMSIDQDQLVSANLAPCGLPKNLLEWQMLYQQQAAAQQKHERNNWGHAAVQDNCCAPQEMHGAAAHGSNCAHLGFGSDTMQAPASQASNKYNTSTVPSNGMLLRNLMGLEALPQDHGGGESSCSAGSVGLMNHHHGLPSSAASLLSSSQGYQGRPDQPTMQLAAYDHLGTATSDLSRNVLFSSATTSTVKMNHSYNANSMSTWIGISNPLTMPTLAGRAANLSHMGSGPIFAHSWTE